MSPKRCASYGPLFGPNSTYTFVEDEHHPNGKCPWVQEAGEKSACQYFCYYDENFGIARINHDLWQAAQEGEAAIWADSVAADDRSEEIVEGFGGYKNVADNVPLGKLLEVGSGPYTQTKALMDGALKPGGLLIFHDRVYDEFWKTIDPVRDAKEVAGLHPLRVKRRLFDRLLEGRYDEIMLSTNLTDAMEVRKANQITEEPIWLLARKK